MYLKVSTVKFLLEPEFEKYRNEYKDICKSEEDVLSCALFPQIAPNFLKQRNDPGASRTISESEEIRLLKVEDLTA